MKYIKYIIPVLIIFLTIGFAATNVTLSITGDAYIASDLEDFEVYISSIKLNGTENISLLGDELTVTFSGDATKASNSPYELAIQLTNNSSRFDAKVEIGCNVSTGVVLQIKEELAESISAKTSDSLTFLIDASNVSSSYLPFSVSCSFTPSPIERTEYGEGEVPDKIDPYAVGTEIVFGTEKFNIISSTDSTVSLLAQQNIDGSTHLQSSNSFIYNFATGSGWEYTPGPKDINVQAWSSLPKTYLNDYVSYLQELIYDETLSGDLITLNQLEKLECSIMSDYTTDSTQTCVNSKYSDWLVNGQTWWTRSAYPVYSTSVWTVKSDGSLYAYFNYTDNAGVRPVITILKNILYRDTITLHWDGVYYEAIEGMSINEWLNSMYNIDGYYLDDGGSIYNADATRISYISSDTIITSSLVVDFSHAPRG